MGFRFKNLNLIIQKSHLLLSSSSSASSSSSSTPRASHPLLLARHSLNSHFPDDSDHFRIIPRRWRFGHSHDHHGGGGGGEGDGLVDGKEDENVFRLGLAADIGLAAGKAFTGYLSGSTAIIADAAHSISDVVLSGVALWSFKAGKAPKDKEHPYGHGKFETLGAFGISCMLLGTAGGIAWHAMDLLAGLLTTSSEVVRVAHEHGHHDGIDMQHPALALSMTIISISVKEGLYWITKKAGERQGSGLMKANAWHHRADAISSVVALIGVGGSILGVKFLDPLAGLLVSGMILKVGLETGYGSILELVDAAIPEEHFEPIKKTILEVKGVKGCHRLRGRRAGSYLFLDVHIEVNPFSSVSTAHRIGENVRKEIHKRHPEIAEVYIHIDPANLNFSPRTVDRQENLEGTASENMNMNPEDKDIEIIVSNIFSSKFPEKLKVERITPHFLQGKILLEIEVSMPPDVLIGDAMEVAKAAEREIMETASNIIQVSIQLTLGRPILKLGLS